jgi:hypothetical protein
LKKIEGEAREAQVMQASCDRMFGTELEKAFVEGEKKDNEFPTLHDLRKRKEAIR